MTNTPLTGGGTQYSFEVEYNGKKQRLSVEKRGDTAWPKSCHIYHSEFPSDECLNRFIKDVQTALGTDRFPSAKIEEFLGNPLGDRVGVTPYHKKSGHTHTLTVTYNGKVQQLKMTEHGARFTLEECTLVPDAFPTLEAKEKLMTKLQEVVGRKEIRAPARDRERLRQIFREGQMGSLTNLKFNRTRTTGR